MTSHPTNTLAWQRSAPPALPAPVTAAAPASGRHGARPGSGGTEPTVPSGAKPRRRLTRRRFLQGVGLGAIALGGIGAYAHYVEPYWVDYHEVRMPIAGLHPAFEGFRIAHLTDLHTSAIVPSAYLRRVVQRVNEMKPDLVVVTGDLVMRHDPWVMEAADILGGLRPPTVISLGNHDYGEHTRGGPSGIRSTAEALQAALTAKGRVVLRNHAIPIRRGDGRFWLVGLEDLWSGNFNVPAAFAHRPAGEVTIALSHNPDTVPAIMPMRPDWILCGHTHGGQVRIPLWGAIILPVTNRQWDEGFFQLRHTRLYVSRAVGFLKPIRFCCRPEVPTFRLTREDAV